MKTIQFILIALLSLWPSVLHAEESPEKQEVANTFKTKFGDLEAKYGVTIHYMFDADEYFPAEWRKSPFSVKGTQATMAELHQMPELLERFLCRYPDGVLQKYLVDIFLLSELEVKGTKLGGTNGNNSIYLSCRGVEVEWRPDFMVGILHAEFSSVLRRKKPFPIKPWTDVNPKGFEYSDLSFEISYNEAWHQDEKLLSDGFIRGFSKTTLDNDFNAFATGLFMFRKELEKMGKEFPRIGQKTALTLEFFRSIDQNFDFQKESDVTLKRRSRDPASCNQQPNNRQ